MPKRRRLYTPNKNKAKSIAKPEITNDDDLGREMSSARGRFKGALRDILEPAAPSDDSELSSDDNAENRERNSDDKKDYSSEDEDRRGSRKSPPRQSYVLKLFDRSVDLSQFRDDSPLYPICRAWMANQPKANYRDNASQKEQEPPPLNSVELPGPVGPPVPKIPKLLPEQLAADKDNINLNYSEYPPTREYLLRLNIHRWTAIKQAWHEQITLKEARYENTQRVLDKINLEYPGR